MKKILIVDDEKYIKQGISAIIKKSFGNAIETEFASDGKEALEKIENKRYDLIISDINMPVLNGMELIEKISKLNEQPEIIVLSGYNEFEYARGCLKFGVKNYLLKPVKRDELVENIRKIFTTLEEEKEEYQEELLQELKKELKNRKKIDKLLEKLGMKSNSYKCYYVKRDAANQYKEFSNENIIYLVDDEKSGYFIVKDKVTLCLIEYDFLAESDFEADIFDAFEMVELLRKYRLITGRKHLMPLDVEGREYFLINDKTIIDIFSYLKVDKIDMALKLFENIFSEDKIEIYDYTTFSDIHASLVRNIFHNKKVFCEFNKEFDELEFHNIYEYIEKIKEIFELLCKNYNDNSTMEAMYIEEAIEYINQNYYKDLNMIVVSKHVSLNYSYFSTLFNKYMKMNFTDYLNQLRIEGSKKYLKDLNLKIYEVAEKVGYKNSKHYSRIFKKLENLTPVEFRLRNRD